MRKLGQGKVLILEITHKAFFFFFFFFYIGLIQQGTLKMTSVSPPRGRLTACLRSMREQDASFFAMLQCQKHLTDGRIQSPPSNASYSICSEVLY